MKKLILLLFALNIVGAFLVGCSGGAADEGADAGAEATVPDKGPEGE